MILPACSVCQSVEIIAVSPGADAETAPGGIVIRRPVPVQAWCLRCWPVMPAQRDLFAPTVLV
jgi:hypothetical protein